MMTVEEYAKKLLGYYAPKCAGNSQSIINKRLATSCAIQDCQNTIEELKSINAKFTSGLIAIETRIKFYSQVIEHLNK